MSRLPRPFLLALAVATLVALGFGPAPAAAASQTVLGDEGELYSIVQGPYGELFPNGAAAPAKSPVLAIDTLSADGSHTRTLVPGTEDPEVDSSPTMVFEESRGTLYLVWESKLNPTTSRLLLAGLSNGKWNEAIEISGDVAPLKGEPRVVVTRDRYVKTVVDGEPVKESRTVIHVLWWEESDSGTGVYYTPVVLANGRYAGWNPVISLDDLASADKSSTKSAEVPSPLLHAPSLEKGRDASSVVAGLVDPSTGEMLLFELRMLPGEIGALADRFRGQVIEIGRCGPTGISKLADKMRTEIVETGTRFNRSVIGLFARQAANALEDDFAKDPDRDPAVRAGDFRGQVIEIGTGLLGDLHGTRYLRSQTVEVGPTAPGQGTGDGAPDGVTHLLQIRLLLILPPPPIGGTNVQVFLSESGENVLVSWAQDGKVFYSESSTANDGKLAWTDPRPLVGADDIPPGEIAEILHDRIRRRP